MIAIRHGFLTGGPWPTDGPQEHFAVGHRAIWKIVKLVKIYSLFNFREVHLCVFSSFD